MTLSAASAQASPLGLNPGDTVASIEWDALQVGGNAGDGGTFTLLTNIFHTQGRINSVTKSDFSTVGQTNVTMDFDLNFVSESNSVLNSEIHASSLLRSPGAMIPGADVVVIQNGNIILYGNFTSDVLVDGVIPLSATSSSIDARGRITILGGDANLVAALGGAGSGQANLFLTATLDDFQPPLNALASDLEIFNSDFTVSLSGTLIPLNASPFVPEPSTAMLLGGGILVLLGASRRMRRH